MKANYELKRLKICQQILPVFDNKAPLIPIRTSSVQERHQADLVVMNKYPVHRGNREYTYLLSILDCFSRYLWLRPLETKTSSSVVREIKKIYNSEGHPRIFQTDQGGELKKEVNMYCRKMGIERIVSAPYHPQSQGKVEASHRGWKKKFAFDLRKSNYKFTDWVSRLQKYAKIYNRQHHESLGTSPFHVCYGILPYHGNEAIAANSPTAHLTAPVAKRLNNASNVRVTANVISDKYAANMVMKQLHKYPPSCYVPGEIVYVKRRRGHKINTSKFFEGIVLTANYAKHMYKVKHDNGIGWFRVSHMAAKTRQAELAMRKLNVPRQRISLRCHCECDTCHKSADLLCSNVISRSCCRISKQKCCSPKHEQHGLSVKDFEKPKNAVTDFINYIHIISPMPDENEEATRDSLMANALAVDLIPEGNVPRDGNCMFHAVSHGLSVNGNSVNQEEVRNAAAKWLEDNQLINGDVHLPDFLYGMGWEQYLNGLRGAEWGDQLALIGIANAFGVAIGIVSSIHVDSGIQYIYPQNNIVGQPCIFLGHEFETHYIRLVPLYETVPMLQSDQQTVEDQGGAGYAKLNSDIRDASEDDQPCADNVGTANEKQSADSFSESVDDQQCAGNRRKADENEQSACGICHVVDDLQSEYSDHRSEDSRRATGDHRSEDYRGAADDHRSEDNRGAADDHRSEDSSGVADDLRSEYSRGAADDLGQKIVAVLQTTIGQKIVAVLQTTIGQHIIAVLQTTIG